LIFISAETEKIGTLSMAKNSLGTILQAVISGGQWQKAGDLCL